VVERLLARDGSVGLATSVEGGGSGKTTLAIQVCNGSEIAGRLPGEVLRVTSGGERRTAALVDILDRICAVLGGRTAAESDPVVVGVRFGELLDGRPAGGRYDLDALPTTGGCTGLSAAAGSTYAVSRACPTRFLFGHLGGQGPAPGSGRRPVPAAAAAVGIGSAQRVPGVLARPYLIRE
jgi:hypothetical protein